MEVDRSRLRRDRVLFYLGLTLFCLGLPGMVLGSWLHDVMRRPVIGEAYYEWGWVNRLFVLLGLFISVLGGGLVGLSLRGGILRETDTASSIGDAR